MSKHTPPALRPRWRTLYLVRWVQTSGAAGRRAYVQRSYAVDFVETMRARGFDAELFETSTRWRPWVKP